MKLIVILIILLISGCTTIGVDTLPMMDTTTVRYITVTAYGITGVKGTVIDRYQYDPKTNKDVLIKSDAFGPGELKIPMIIP